MLNNIIRLKNTGARPFFNGHKRSIEARRNIVRSFLIKGVSISVNLLIVPITLNYVSSAQYGVWLTLTSIVAWLSFFDIGFGNGLRNKFAESKASGDVQMARIYISTTYAVLFLIFGGLCASFLIFYRTINWPTILNAPKLEKNELATLSLIIVSFFCLQIILKTINTVLIADQKPAKSAFFDMVGQILSLGTIAVLSETTRGSLVYLALALGSVPTLVLVFSSFWFYNTKYRAYAPSLKFVDFSYARNIMGLGIKFFFLQIAGVIIYQTSNIIIAHSGGAVDVTIYNIAFKYFAVATMFFSIIMTPFWSAFTEAFYHKDYGWMKGTVKSLRRVVLLMIGFVACLVIISDEFYSLWVGDMVPVRTSVTAVMAVFVVINIWNSLHSIILNGMGKITLQLVASSAATLIYVPLALFLGKRFGIEGVVAAGILISLISAVFAPIQVRQLLNGNARGVWNA